MTREQTFPDLLWRDIKWLLPATAASVASYSQTLSSSGAAIRAVGSLPARSAGRRRRTRRARAPAPARRGAARSAAAEAAAVWAGPRPAAAAAAGAAAAHAAA